MVLNQVQNVRISNSNASASAFGWDFQANAAILLMLENIENAKSIKVEGRTEDIEITLNNNNIIYSQAKSIEDINSTSNLITKLQEGMRTLSNAYNKGDSESLIYITNHSNPFNDKFSIQYFLGRTKLGYEELPQKCKDKINKIIEENQYSIDTSKLKIYVLPFWGEDKDNRDKAIKEAVAEFLAKLEIQTQYTPQKMLEIWQRDFFHNATIPNEAIQINKKDMIWSLIVEVCNFDYSDKYLEDCDAALIEEIEYRYKSIIDNKSEEFTFVNKILNDYDQYNKQLSIKERTEKFVNEEFINYLDEFDISNFESEVKNCLVKLIINKIISKRLTISRIKKGANICD